MMSNRSHHLGKNTNILRTFFVKIIIHINLKELKVKKSGAPFPSIINLSKLETTL